MKIMSAGPTSIPERVRNALVRNFTNGDLDKEYIKFHHEVENKISKILNTQCRSFIMLGEAMLGLDGACASFVEKDDDVLVLINGIFSEGFVDFVKMYGGNPEALYFDLRKGIDVNKLENFIDNSPKKFKSAFMVHCETPSGISNDISKICNLLNKKGILSIVDSVSGIGGEKINFDEDKIDCIIGGTQKCLSAPAGLTTITLSRKAEEYLNNRKSQVSSFYGNFQNYIKSGEFEFPYTPSDNLVYSLDEALNILLEKDSVSLHADFAQRTRRALLEAGLEIYAKDHYSNTVTTVIIDGINTQEILNGMKQKGFIISGGMGSLNGKAIRIGHMGNNISDENEYAEMLESLTQVLNDLGIKTEINLAESFLKSNP